MKHSSKATPAKKATDWALYKRFWPYLRPYRRAVFLGLTLVPLLTLCNLAQPYLLKVGIDDYILGNDPQGLIYVAGVLLGVVLLAYLFSATQAYLLQVSALKALGDLRRGIYDHVMRQGSAFFDRHPSGSLLTRTTTDVEGLGETLTMGMVGIFADILTIIGVITAMLILDVRLTLLTFCVSPLLVLLVNVFRKHLRTYSVQIRKSLARLNGYLAEHLVGIKVVQLFGREKKSQREFKSLSYTFLDAYRKSNWLDASLYALMDGISSVCVAIMLWYGGNQFLSTDGSALSIGLLVAFIEYITRVFVPIREFSAKIATLQRAVAALERIFNLMDTHMEVSSPPSVKTRTSFEESIHFEDVSFQYLSEGEQVLKKVHFVLKPGTAVALVGQTGSGKTTIGKVLTRMYDGYEGSIRIGETELRNIPTNETRKGVGMVHQDVTLFEGTILDNITLGRKDISREQAIRAATLVRANSFIQELPDGYDAHVVERGANLSAGQCQLIAFARAMAYDPPVLVLDEATASIDSFLEQEIQEALRVILSMKTVLIVAHRLSTIQQADNILLMEKGEIIERGDHTTLLAKNGKYARLVHSRFHVPSV